MLFANQYIGLFNFFKNMYIHMYIHNTYLPMQGVPSIKTRNIISHITRRKK